MLEQPVPFSIAIPMVGGLNAKHDPGSEQFRDTDLQLSENALFDDGITEKATQFSKINSANQLESGAKIDGVWRSYADEGTSRLIVVCNGKIFESSDWVTPIYSGLTAGKRCTFRNYRGKTIISNGSDTPKVYDPKTNTLIGNIVIQGPNQIKKIAYFETDESWTGGTVDTEIHVYDELSGPSLQGYKLTAAASGSDSAELTGLSLDLSQYADAKSVDGWDYIDLSTYHKIWKNVQQIELYFQTSVGNYYQFIFDRESLDVDENGVSQKRNYQWTHHKIQRNRFTKSGSPNWNNITTLKIVVQAEATGTAEVTFDNYRLRRTPPVAGAFRVDIATFEPSEETWTGGALDFFNFKRGLYGGSTALKLVDGDETANCPKSLDLTKWPNGLDTTNSDEIRMWGKLNDSTKFTNITLKLGDSGMANYYYKTWSTFETGTDIWNELVCAMTDFSSTGTPSWSTIAKVQIEATIAAGGIAYFDHVALVLKNDQVSLSDMEPGTSGETWTFPNGGVKLSTRYKSRGAYSLRGTTSAHYVWERCIMQVVFSTAKDMTQWTDGLASTVDDLFAFWMFAENWNYNIKDLYILIDCNSGDFATDYYERYVNSAEWAGILMSMLASGDPTVRLPKASFTRHGSSGGKDWSTVKGIHISTLTFPGHPTDPVPTRYYWVDDLHMERAATNSFSGKFRWKVVFKYGDLRSAPSEASDWLELDHEIALLKKIPGSGDSRVTQREIYRQSYEDLGSPDMETFYLAGTIFDNSTEEWIDDILEPGLSMKEMGVPEGTYEAPKGVVVTEFKDQIVLLQILDALKSIKYSEFANIYAWSDLGGRDFPTEVVNGITHFDNFFVFARDGHIHQVADNIAEGGSAPLGEMVKCVSPWGVCKVEEEIAILSDSDILLFTGYGARSIGTDIEDYLDPENYKIEEGVLFYHRHHLYYAVETRAGGTYKFFDCYVPGVKWTELPYLSVNCFCAYTGRGDKNELIVGGTDGYVYKLATTYNHAMKIRTKDFGTVETNQGKGFLFNDKELGEIRVIAKGGDATSDKLTVKIFVDGVDTGVSRTIPATGHLATKYHTYVIPIKGIENAPLGQLIGVQIEHGVSLGQDKNAFIKAIMLSGEVLPLEQQFTDQ